MANLQSKLANVKQSAAAKAAATKQALQKAAERAKQAGKKLILYVPKDYEGQGSSLNELVKAADDLGIEVHRSEKNSTALAKEIFGTGEQLLGLTERGLALFAPTIDKLLSKYNFSNSAGNLANHTSKAASVLSTLQNFLGTALSSMDLDELIQRRKNGEKIGGEELAKASIDLINQLVDTASSIVSNLDSFSSQLNKLGDALSQTKHLGNVGNKLKNLPNFGNVGSGIEALSGVLSAVSAAFILADKKGDKGTQAAAGVELSAKVLGNVGKAVSKYIIAYRVARGLSTSAASAGLIASMVTLAISPLSFLNVASQFDRAKELEKLSQRFKKFGYEGDALLASFHRESGTIEAALTTINTVMNAISAGVSAASAASLVGAPVSLLVGAITSIISGILEASKQAMFEHIADKLASEIAEWEKKNGGKNYFENGYDSRHAEYIAEKALEKFSELAKEYKTQRSLAIIQQHWDENIGELAGVTRNGARIKSGKGYAELYEDGKIKSMNVDQYKQVVFDPLKGNIALPDSDKSTSLSFVRPTFAPGEEIRSRKQEGKYEYMTSLLVKGVDRWVVTGVQNASGVYDYANLIQFMYAGYSDLTKGGRQYRELKIVSNLGKRNDTVFLGAGSSEVNAGEGHDTVYYNKTETGYLTVDGRNATQAGNYTVSKGLGGDVKILQEVVKEQKVRRGKSTETLQYRHYEMAHSHNHNLKAVDKLNSVEEIFGGMKNDTFYGSKFNDIFHGGKGNDVLEGNDGDDRLYGDSGDDILRGGNGNDRLSGGEGNDKLFGGQGNDFLDGGDGDDELQTLGGKNDKNILLGGAGNDKLYGSTGDDLLDGGTGNDLMYGGLGNDIYRYKDGYGNHIIEDNGGYDKLSLANLTFRDVYFQRDGDNLVMTTMTQSRSTITFKNWFKKPDRDSSDNKIEEIIDKDGRVLTHQELDKFINDSAKAKGGSDTHFSWYYTYPKQEALTSLGNDIQKIISSVGNFGGDSAKPVAASLYSSMPTPFNTYNNTLAASAA
ncbi:MULTISPECIES: RTX family hemolysin [Rodentibacter]|uniref:RTX family hemolysin n=1 Tax=Rodentibacter TaxID=1960084 RepID=UPI001CFDFACC|nr:RTX family hemolysin [Rodentibacter sp. JRC1]GJI56504.1 hemolysin A [Rodentibacter sp. JRC1]